MASAQPKDEVVVTLEADADATTLASDYNATLADTTDSQVVALVPGDGQTSDELLVQLAGDYRVASAEKNTLVETAETRQQSAAFDDGYGSALACASQPALSAVGLGVAHRISTGSGVRIAILDTGAELTHPALAGRIAGGWDFVEGDAVPTEAGDGLDNDYDGRVDEALGHGTHVAGIASLVAPGAELLILRVLDGDGRGDMLTVARAVRWAVANGARVINMSLGGLWRSDAVQLSLNEAQAAGVVCVAAAGNWGSIEPEEFPASSQYALGIAALDPAGVAATFTSHGEHIALSAPGVAIRSAFLNGGWALWSGTSMAAPFVSGGAALLLALHPDWTRKRVLDRMAITARNIDALNPGYDGYLGAGALDLGAALTAEFMVEDPAELTAHF